MQNEQNDRRGNLILVITGVFGSIFFIYFGYLIAAMIGYVQDNSTDILTGMYMILKKPFAKYFNLFTPITMILGFIVFEGIFFLIVMHGKKSENNEDEVLVDSDVIDIAEKSFEKNAEQKVFSTDNLFDEAEPADNNNLGISEPTYVSPESPEEIDTTDSVFVPIENDKNTDKTVEMSFSDEVVTELLNDYDLSQIKAMLAIKAHIDPVDVSLLKRMFKPTMSADEITNYIKIFYD